MIDMNLPIIDEYERIKFQYKAKAEVIEDLARSIKTNANDADYQYNEILRIKEEAGEAFSEESWEYRHTLECLYKDLYEIDILKNLIENI